MSYPITVLSFGYLHPWPEGIEKPSEDDTHDLREKLRDPAHVLPEEKRDLTGLDPEIEAFVFSTPGVQVVFGSILDRTLMKAAEASVTVAIGCAGGRHRSVAVANVMRNYLRPLGYEVSVEHLHVHLPRVIRK
jgi:UPF0042 nucleotide-binding protein